MTVILYDSLIWKVGNHGKSPGNLHEFHQLHSPISQPKRRTCSSQSQALRPSIRRRRITRRQSWKQGFNTQQVRLEIQRRKMVKSEVKDSKSKRNRTWSLLNGLKVRGFVPWKLSWKKLEGLLQKWCVTVSRSMRWHQRNYKKLRPGSSVLQGFQPTIASQCYGSELLLLNFYNCPQDHHWNFIQILSNILQHVGRLFTFSLSFSLGVHWTRVDSLSMPCQSTA